MLIFGLPTTALGVVTFIVNNAIIDLFFALFICSQTPLRRETYGKRRQFSAKNIYIITQILHSFLGRFFWFPFMQDYLFLQPIMHITWLIMLIFFFGKKTIYAAGYFYLADSLMAFWHCITLLFALPSGEIPIWGHADTVQELGQYFLNGLFFLLASATVLFLFPRLKLSLQFRWWHIVLFLVGSITMNAYILGTLSNPQASNWHIIILYVYMSVYFAFFYVVFNRMQLNRLKTSKRQLLQLNELYEDYYYRTRQNSLLIQTIKKDIAAGLQRVHQHAAQEQPVQNEINRLLQLQQKQKQFFYCENPVVDAVLISKAQTMQDNHIDFKADILLPKTIPLQSMHLAALLTNALDNAIEASGQLDENRIISLLMKVQQGQLVLHCNNRCRKLSKNLFKTKRVGHGLGLAIMRDIVEAHHGFLQTDQAGDKFTLSMIIPLESEARH